MNVFMSTSAGAFMQRQTKITAYFLSVCFCVAECTKVNATFVHIQDKLGDKNLLRIVEWIRKYPAPPPPYT